MAFFKAIIIYVSFTQLAFSWCALEGSHDEFASDLQAVVDEVNLTYNGAEEEIFMNAPCKSKTVPDVNAYLASFDDKEKENRRVKNFQFQNEPKELVDAFRDLTKNFNQSGDQSCTTVLCAVDSIWGPELGRKILYIRAKHGYNTSEYGYSNTHRITNEEIDQILIAFGDLPVQYERLGARGNQRLSMARPGDRNPGANPDAAATGAIRVFDAWRVLSPYYKQYTMMHEFAHNIGDVNGRIDESSEWRQLIQCKVSIYGNGNGNTRPQEDFAETVMMYRYHAEELRRRCPEKYEILRSRIFNGLEYLSEATCRPGHPQ